MIRNLEHRKEYIRILGPGDDPAIGEIFTIDEFPDIKLITIQESNDRNCIGCYFNRKNIDCNLAPKCVFENRKDSKSVIFKEYD